MWARGLSGRAGSGARDVVVSRTGMGPINAVAATAIAIERFHPAAIIDQGTAGAHNPALQIWDIVLGAKTWIMARSNRSEAAAGEGVDPARWKPIAHEIDGEAVSGVCGRSRS